MVTFNQIDNTTQTAERGIRAVQGFCLIAALANCGPITVGGRRFTPTQLSELAFSGRVCILSLDLLKDVYCLTFAKDDTRSFKELHDEHKVCTFGNTRDLSGLVVDLSTVGLLLTDTLKLLPANRVTNLLNDFCDPFLVTLFIILLREANNNHKKAKTSLDLIHVLAPYLLAKWADKITPFTLVATGVYGAIAVWK